MNRFSKLALACAMAFSASHALAASQASASLSDITFTVIDLTPDDGIAPSFTILNGGTRLSVNAGDGQIGESRQDNVALPGTFSYRGTVLAELSRAQAFSLAGSDALTVRGSANGIWTSFQAWASTGIVSPDYGIGLQVAANTLLLIDAKANLSAAAVNGQGLMTEDAYSWARMDVFYTYHDAVTDTFPDVHQVRTEDIRVTATWDHKNSTKTFQDAWHFEVRNTTERVVLGTMGLQLQVSGAATTAVPEPGTWGLGLAGLFVAGQALSRRGRRQV